jgi:DNA-binding transcriptional LysR family regulator
VSVLTLFPSHPLWGIESISEKELLSLLKKDANFVSRPRGSGLYEAARKYLEPRLGKSETDSLLTRRVAYDLDKAKEWVSEGLGISIMPNIIAIMPNIIVSEDVSSGKMWAVGLPGDVSRPFYGIWARDRGRSAVTEEFIALLKAGLE